MIRFTFASRSTAVAALVVAMLIPMSAEAQQPTRPMPSIRHSAIELAIKAEKDTRPAAKLVAPAVQATTTRRERSVGRKILGAAIGATAGLFVGGWVGGAIEGDGCNCDDPGLMGALIGAPIGMAVGGILGFKLF